jgi:hypothetical protein
VLKRDPIESGEPLQLFAPYRSRRAGRIRPARFQGMGNWHGGPCGKPRGGVWTSTYTPHAPTESDWVRFCQESHPDWIPAHGYLYAPASGVKIYRIDTADDLRALVKRCGDPARDPPAFEIDFEALARDYDGIHLTTAGLEQTHQRHLECWDAEGTCWSRPEVLRYLRRIRVRRQSVPRHPPEE